MRVKRHIIEKFERNPVTYVRNKGYIYKYRHGCIWRMKLKKWYKKEYHWKLYYELECGVVQRCLINTAKSFLGYYECSGDKPKSYKKILDIYNTHKPLPRGYKVAPHDPWGAVFVSAVAIKADCDKIIPLECSCFYMMHEFKVWNQWHPKSEGYKPKPGDVVFFQWSLPISSSNYYPEQVGIVHSCDSTGIWCFTGNNGPNREVSEKHYLYSFVLGYGEVRWWNI